jgi:hypothetical protein
MDLLVDVILSNSISQHCDTGGVKRVSLCPQPPDKVKKLKMLVEKPTTPAPSSLTTDIWFQYLRLLVRFRMMHGHMNVPPNDKEGLAEWLAEHKSLLIHQAKGGTIQKEMRTRLQLLEQLGFASEIIGDSIYDITKYHEITKEEQGFQQKFIRFMLSEKALTREEYEKRDKWIQELRRQYNDIKAHCTDSYLLFQVNFRCNIFKAFNIHLDILESNGN